MALVILELRPCVLLLRRSVSAVSVSFSNPRIKRKHVNTHLHLSSRDINVPFKRLSHTISQDDIDELYFEHDYSAEEEDLREKAALNMQKIFGGTKMSAQVMVKKHPVLKSVTLNSAKQNYKYLINKGVSKGALKENPWLLTYKIGTITSKLEVLSKLDLGDINAALPLLQLSLYRLKENSKVDEKECNIIPQGNRIKYTCGKLQCDMIEVCRVFGQHEFLYSIPFAKYSYIMEKLLDAGISPSHILKDVWVFQYSIQKIESRLEILKEVGVNPVKPWMLRSSPKVFETTLQRVLSRREVLGEHSVVEYLRQQLECDEKTVELLTSKYPLLLRKHVPKLKEVFDFLYDEDFTPQQVIQVPRILFHNVDTIKSRLTELREAGCNPASLMTLCKSKREFKKIIEIAKKKKTTNFI